LIPAIILLILFLLIASQTRGIILRGISTSVGWIESQPPLSRAVICILLIAVVIAIVLLLLWPNGAKSRRSDSPYK